ncbi:uncharacterized protein LOC112049883 isoform X2 [Bicyclus anynana]|uniref:Uncharacterized protein LOC112049883 isoform X2 n=1 Tax=Bicyclus anynana TaxID=110368 RepID=A0A6J1NFH4_BICAN|nr:uncharacterized protein LOC112049883 isoform X2 [Bicyclus anynana]
MLKFPTSGKTRKEWIRFVQNERREESWQPSTASKLCSKHFRKKDIKVGKTGRACLKKGSMPCENYDNKPKLATSESDDESDSKLVIDEVQDDDDEDEDEDDSKSENDDQTDSKSLTDDTSNSKLDDPAEISLKAEVTTLRKQRLRQQAKISKLEQQNQLLKRKLAKLKNFVIHLVKKYDLQITGQKIVTPRK